MPSTATGNVRVLVRVRPLNTAELTEHGSSGRSNVLTVESNGNGEIDFSGDNKENGASLFVTNALDSAKQFTFDAVHGDSSTQEEVYNSVKGIVDAVVEGYNGTIVAYGQTGSGKTHTVFGSGVRGDHKGVGIVQRSLREIFSKFSQLKSDASDKETCSSSKTTFKGSFIEIFNERVYDLLSPDTLENNLQVRENVRGGGVYIEGLKEVDLLNTAEAEALLTSALANRHVASTNMNRTSSRSHAMFVLSVRTEHIDQDGLRKVRSSKFTLVDLAGSERQKSTGTTGNRLKEASMINKSLLCLGEVINKLVDREHGKSKHIPFRNSKLTFLLKDTWGGNSKTCLVATVSPSAHAQSETLSTLQFAQRAKLVKNNAILNEDTCGTVAALQAELARLQSELKWKGMIAETDTSNEKETLSSLRRQNQRKEKKIDELERDLEQERSLSNALKRKLQEESFSRKLKERRLENVEKRNKDADENEQMEMLKLEIKSLQQRLDAPSEDAIRWKVAYEEAQEALEEKLRQGTDDVDISELLDRNAELEEALDRLLAEKTDLESKVTDLTESSNETQQEIDSIMNEVDILEKEMHDLQDQLEEKNRECCDANSKITLSDIERERMRLELDEFKKNKFELESKLQELQVSLNLISDELKVANSSLNEKDEYLNEIQKSLEQKQLDYESKIEYLTNELNDLSNAMKEKDESITLLSSKVDESSSDMEVSKNLMKDALENLNLEKNRVAMLQERLETILVQNEEHLNNIHEKNKIDREQLICELLEKDNIVARLKEEVENQDAIIHNFKDEISVFQGTLEDKTETIENLEKLSLEFTILEKTLNDEIVRLKDSLDEATFELQNNAAALEKSLSDKSVLDSKVAEMEQQAEYNVSIIKSLRDDVKLVTEEKAAIQEQLDSVLSDHNEKSERIALLEKKLHDCETSIKDMTDCHTSMTNSLIHSNNETEKSYLKAIDGLKMDKTNLELEIQRLSEDLKMKTIEIDTLMIHSREMNIRIEDLMKMVSDYEHHSSTEIDRVNSVRDQFLKEISEKENEIKLLHEECADSKKSFEESSERLNAIILENNHLKSSIEEVIKLRENDFKRANEKQKLLEDEIKLLQQKLDTLASVEKDRDSLFHELCTLKSEISSIEQAAKISEAKILSSNQMNKDLEESYRNQLIDKEREIELLREKLTTQNDTDQDDYSSLTYRELQMVCKNKGLLATGKKDDLLARLDSYRNQSNDKEQEVEVLQQKLTCLDQELLEPKGYSDLVVKIEKLSEEKQNLEFQLDSLREDQDIALEESRDFQHQISALRNDNEELKRIIQQLRAFSDEKSLNTESSSMLSSGSTWASDNRLSYGTTVAESTLAKTEPSVPPQPVAEDLDDSFDEEAFLPDDFLTNVENDHICHDEKDMNQENGPVLLSTPNKTGEYGKRRIPLSDRKNTMTPFKSTSKYGAQSSIKKKLKSTSKIMSSARKLMSSSTSKMPKTCDYMFINNKKLFEE